MVAVVVAGDAEAVALAAVSFYIYVITTASKHL